MPRTTKETAKKKDEKLIQTSTSAKKSASKTVAKKPSSKKTSTKKPEAKSTTKKQVSKTTSSKKASATKKATSSKKTPSKISKETKTKETKKTVAKKAAVKKVDSKATSSKKTTSAKKTTAKKAATKKTVKKDKTKKLNSINTLEYYDLPYRYNQTVVKMLAQTPKRLFVYWDISDYDRKSYIDQYGEKFFENTKPVLIIHNKTMNYSFEIEINDFANCWYFDINDEKCEYEVELGRKPKEYINENIQIPNNYLYIASSNEIESPNGHILFEKAQNTVFFRNVKTNKEFSRDITSFEFMRYFGKIYSTHDLYKKMYSDEDLLDIDNPSSNFKIY